MTVVLAPGWPGILLHEAVGHGLEADFNRKGTSAFSGRVGQKVAAPSCAPSSTTARSRTGAAPSTSTTRATPTRRTVLIENGVLARLHARPPQRAADGMRATGNGRRE